MPDYLLMFWQLYPGVVIYLVAINVVTVFVYGFDKLVAQSHAWRVRERTLLLLAALGGSIGALIAINIFHHKTRKNKFLMPLAVILLLQLALIGLLLTRLPIATLFPAN